MVLCVMYAVCLLLTYRCMFWFTHENIVIGVGFYKYNPEPTYRQEIKYIYILYIFIINKI